MRPLIADLHMHTLVSGHAYGTIREMAAAAAERGLAVIGITEHAPGIPGTVDPFYYLNLRAVPPVLSGVRVLHGSEVNVLPGGSLSLEDRYLNCLDYAIVGIHGPCYSDAGREGNTDALLRCMAHPKVRFVSHPDDDHTPLNYERLVAGARDCHVALEVNNSSLLKPQVRLNCRENYRVMLDLCARLRVPIIVSSDAHDPSAVGRFAEAEQLLEEYAFDPELVLTRDRAALERFLALP